LKPLRELAEWPTRIERNRKYSSKNNSDTQKQRKVYDVTDKMAKYCPLLSAQISFCGHITEEHKKG
jgi:hypothetical protein